MPTNNAAIFHLVYNELKAFQILKICLIQSVFTTLPFHLTNCLSPYLTVAVGLGTKTTYILIKPNLPQPSKKLLPHWLLLQGLHTKTTDVLT